MQVNKIALVVSLATILTGCKSEQVYDDTVHLPGEQAVLFMQEQGHIQESTECVILIDVAQRPSEIVCFDTVDQAGLFGFGTSTTRQERYRIALETFSVHMCEIDDSLPHCLTPVERMLLQMVHAATSPLP